MLQRAFHMDGSPWAAAPREAGAGICVMFVEAGRNVFGDAGVADAAVIEQHIDVPDHNAGQINPPALRSCRRGSG